MLRTITFGLLTTLYFAQPALAQHKSMETMPMAPGGVSVDRPWARASASSGGAGAAYFVVHNKGERADRLVEVSTPVAGRAELHTHEMKNNVMRMRHVGSVPLAPGKSVTLKPGGYHVMLMGLKRKLVKGQEFPLTLRFERAGTITVNVAVGSIAAMGPQGGMKMPGGMKMDHGKHGK